MTDSITEIALGIIREEVPKIMRKIQELRDLPSNSPNIQACINKVVWEMIRLEKELGLRRYDIEAASVIERDIRGRIMAVIPPRHRMQREEAALPDIDLADYE